jgi:hypothetical protein
MEYALNAITATFSTLLMGSVFLSILNAKLGTILDTASHATLDTLFLEPCVSLVQAPALTQAQDLGQTQLMDQIQAVGPATLGHQEVHRLQFTLPQVLHHQME